MNPEQDHADTVYKLREIGLLGKYLCSFFLKTFIDDSSLREGIPNFGTLQADFKLPDIGSRKLRSVILCFSCFISMNMGT